MKKGLFLLFLLLMLAGCYNNHNNIIISYNTYGGSFVESEMIQSGDSINTSKTSNKEGYNFGGWYYDDSYLLKAEKTDLIVNNLVLHAKWDPKEYEIVFMETNVPSIKSPYLSKISLPILETKENEYFHGWYLDEALTIPFILEYMPLDGAILYPRFETNQIVVRFFNGEDLVRIETCEYNSFILPPEGPKRYGYEFINWDSDLNNITESIDVFAEFKLKEYNVTFHPNNNDEIITEIYSYLNLIEMPLEPERDGYIFGGWYLDSKFNNKYVFNIFREENLNLYAKWDNPFTFKLKENDTYKIINYNGYIKRLVIPSEHEGKKISEIDVYAFSNNKEIEKIEIGENIRKIGDYAFKNCINLKTVFIDKKINEIGKGLFSGCNQIEKMSIPFIGGLKEDGQGFAFLFDDKDLLPKKVVILDTETIKDNAFKNCEGIFTIVLPEKTKIIGKNAFANCYDLESINIPLELEKISEGAFINCINLHSINLNENLKTIKNYAFFGCTRLEKINYIENTKLIELGEGCFFACESLKSIYLPDTLEKIGKGAFGFCMNIITIGLPEGINVIESYTFYNCKSLKEVYIPTKVSSIELKAFGECENIIEIYLPRSLVYISEKAFKNAKTGIDIFYEGSIEEWDFYIREFNEPKYNVDYLYNLE